LAGKKEGCHDDVEFITVQRNKTLPAGSDAAPAALPSSTLLQPLSTSSVDLGHPAEVGWAVCCRHTCSHRLTSAYKLGGDTASIVLSCVSFKHSYRLASLTRHWVCKASSCRSSPGVPLPELVFELTLP